MTSVVNIVSVQVVYGTRERERARLGVRAQRDQFDIWHLSDAGNLTEFAHEVGVAKPQQVHDINVLLRWLIREDVLNHRDAVDLFGYEDADEDGASFVDRVHTDEAAAEQADDDGDPPTRAPWEAA
jgi:hypothetical protein